MVRGQDGDDVPVPQSELEQLVPELVREPLELLIGRESARSEAAWSEDDVIEEGGRAGGCMGGGRGRVHWTAGARPSSSSV